jgi:hypothetical protein
VDELTVEATKAKVGLHTYNGGRLDLVTKGLNLVRVCFNTRGGKDIS